MINPTKFAASAVVWILSAAFSAAAGRGTILIFKAIQIFCTGFGEATAALWLALQTQLTVILLYPTAQHAVTIRSAIISLFTIGVCLTASRTGIGLTALYSKDVIAAIL